MTSGLYVFSRGEDPLRADKLNAAIAERLLVVGDTMLGPLILVRDPILPFEAATKQYIDAIVTENLTDFLHTSGGTLTGPLISTARISVTGAPITTDGTMLCHHLAAGIPGGTDVGGFVGSWNEVDNNYAGFYCDTDGNIIFASAEPALGFVGPTDPRAAINPDGSMQVYKDLTVLGQVFVSAAPASGSALTNKTYVDAKVAAGAGGVSEAPNDGKLYGRGGAAWSQVLPSTGGTIAGSLAVTGTVTVGGNGVAYPTIALNGAPATGDRQIAYYSNSVVRWTAGASAGAEGGGNAGSDFTFNRFNDAGTYQGSPLTISRATGNVTMPHTLTVQQQISAAGAVTSGAQIVSAFSLAGKSGAGQGGFIGSWNASNNDNQGIWSAGGTLNFGFADLAGTPTVYYGGFDKSGNFSAAATIQNSSGNIVSKNGVYANGDGNYGLASYGSTRALVWTGVNGYQDTFETTTGFRNWLSFDGVTMQMRLAFNGDLTIAGGTAVKVGGGSWAATSDARVKDVQGAYTNGLDAVCALHPVHYRYKDNEQDFIGLIAQEAEVDMPEMVTKTTGKVGDKEVDDLRMMDTSPLVFALVNAVKELSARVVELEKAAR